MLQQNGKTIFFVFLKKNIHFQKATKDGNLTQNEHDENALFPTNVLSNVILFDALLKRSNIVVLNILGDDIYHF